MEELVTQIEQALADVERELSDPDVSSDLQRMAQLGRRHKELSEQAALGQRWRTASQGIDDAREMLESESDPEMRSYLEAELASSEEAISSVEEQLRLALVERDPNDERDVIIELRPGAGGDEAALFTGDIYRMLMAYAQRLGYQVEALTATDSDQGGFREATLEVRGDGAYSVFKWESGVHRVQRVPETESQGRIHTSTMTVAVLPEAEDVDVHIELKDIKIDVMRSTGPGGQSVNTTDSAVRITHKPTGIVVSMQDEKSQLQNKDKAMRVLRARLLEREVAEQQAKVASERKAQVGSGERSEKVRTYNFPQGRVTDHRIKHTSHNLEGVLAGELGEFTDALSAEEKRQRLEAAASAA